MIDPSTGFPWLTILWALPLVGALVVAFLPRGLAKPAALGISVVTLVIAVLLGFSFDTGGAGYQFSEDLTWISSFGAHYALGVDGLGLSLVVLTAILTPVVLAASWDDAERVGRSGKGLFAWMLALEGMAIAVFAATDVFLFYIFFEATLIPVYFMVGTYGGAKRSQAAIKFLIYSLIGGLVMLASVIGLYVQTADSKSGPTYLVSDLASLHISGTTGHWLFLGFFIAFAIKAPMFPVHTWLPDTTEAATPGTSVMLVSVLDKIGTFGMLRFCLEIFPDASTWATPVVLGLAVISILYGAFMAIGSQHIMRLIAYTSVSHFGFIVLGIFVMNSQGLTGASLYMFNHGLSTAALFLVSGYLISRRGSALIEDFGGVEKVAPVLAGVFLVAGLSSLSLPGLAPFVSEMMVLVGAFVHSAWVAAFAVPGIVLAAIYILWMYQRIFTGPPRPELVGWRDLRRPEVLAVAPVLVLVVVLGFYPKPLTDLFTPTTQHTMQQVHRTDPSPTVAGAGQRGGHQ